MPEISSVATTPPSAGSQFGSESLNDVKLDGFLKLMISELQNQDPLDPMKNSEMLQQLSQIRSIGATDQLTSTLDAVLIGQNVTTASSLIGRQISALSDDGENISGEVNRVTVESGGEGQASDVRVHIGDQSVKLSNIREILRPTEAG